MCPFNSQTYYNVKEPKNAFQTPIAMQSQQKVILRWDQEKKKLHSNSRRRLNWASPTIRKHKMTNLQYQSGKRLVQTNINSCLQAWDHKYSDTDACGSDYHRLNRNASSSTRTVASCRTQRDSPRKINTKTLVRHLQQPKVPKHLRAEMREKKQTVNKVWNCRLCKNH